MMIMIMKAIATAPWETHYFFVADFGALQSVVQDVLDSSCNASATVATVSVTSSTTAAISTTTTTTTTSRATTTTTSGRITTTPTRAVSTTLARETICLTASTTSPGIQTPPPDGRLLPLLLQQVEYKVFLKYYIVYYITFSGRLEAHVHKTHINVKIRKKLK